MSPATEEQRLMDLMAQLARTYRDVVLILQHRPDLLTAIRLVASEDNGLLKAVQQFESFAV